MSCIRYLPFVLLLSACPDPSKTAEGPGSSASVGAPVAGPEAGSAGQGGPSQAGSQGFKVTPGEGVFLKGTFTYEGTKAGRNRIDFVTIQEGAPPNLVYAMTLEQTGAWQVEVPKDFGKLHILGFIDQAEDGPSPGDPATPMGDPIVIEGADIEGIELKLIDTSETVASPPTPTP